MTKKRKYAKTNDSCFWDILKEHMSEEELYESYLKRESWSIQEFAALAAGMTPDNYKRVNDEKTTSVTQKEFDQYRFANDILEKFICAFEHSSAAETKELKRKLRLVGDQAGSDTAYASSWRFLKWAAMTQLPMKMRFFKHLSLTFKEIFLEFTPENVALRTASKYDLEYHQALYLTNARELQEDSPRRLSYPEIYNHPRMRNVLESIHYYCGGKRYKKSTIIKSWLPKLEKRNRGRPKKCSVKT